MLSYTNSDKKIKDSKKNEREVVCSASMKFVLAQLQVCK